MARRTGWVGAWIPKPEIPTWAGGTGSHLHHHRLQTSKTLAVGYRESRKMTNANAGSPKTRETRSDAGRW